MLRGEETRHFSARWDNEWAGIADGDFIKFDLWVARSGQLRQFKMHERYLDYMGDLEREHIVTTVFSHQGAAVRVEAPTRITPVLNPTPVPTPEGLFE